MIAKLFASGARFRLTISGIQVWEKGKWVLYNE